MKDWKSYNNIMNEGGEGYNPYDYRDEGNPYRYEAITELREGLALWKERREKTGLWKTSTCDLHIAQIEEILNSKET